MNVGSTTDPLILPHIYPPEPSLSLKLRVTLGFLPENCALLVLISYTRALPFLLSFT